jgi:hypothetical protein
MICRCKSALIVIELSKFRQPRNIFLFVLVVKRDLSLHQQKKALLRRKPREEQTISTIELVHPGLQKANSSKRSQVLQKRPKIIQTMNKKSINMKSKKLKLKQWLPRMTLMMKNTSKIL